MLTASRSSTPRCATASNRPAVAWSWLRRSRSPGPGRTRRRCDRSRVSDRLCRRLRSRSAIAAEVTGSSVCGLARCNDRDIDRAWEAIQYAQKPRIHVFLATSAIHREHKLRMSKAQIIEKAVEGVRRAKETAPTSSSAPKTQPAPRSIFSATSSRPPLKPGPRPSTFPIPSATPHRFSTAR